MLLTLKPSTQSAFSNPYASTSASTTSRVAPPPYSPPSNARSYPGSPPSRSSLLPLPSPSDPHNMSTPHRGLPLPGESNLLSASHRGLPPPSEHNAINSAHRGLPPPLGMTLPSVDRNPTVSAATAAAHPPAPPQPQPQPPSVAGGPTSMPGLPAPPSQWSQNHADESMRSWLAAKAEEDRRKQEEEKTHQETLRLEQRRIEHSMLRESLSGGVPSYMVPMIFAGMGGANLANTSLEWAQHHMSQMTLQQQAGQAASQQHPAAAQLPPSQAAQALAPGPPAPHSQPLALPPTGSSSPDLRRDRAGGPNPNPYAQHPLAAAAAAAAAAAGAPAGAAPGSAVATSFAYDRLRNPVALQAAPTSMPRGPNSGSLSRLNTGEMQVQAPPLGGAQVPLPHPHAQIQGGAASENGPVGSSQPSGQSSAQGTPNSIHFHHWVPPSTQKEPPTPSGKSQHGSPYTQNAGSHLRSEYAQSPKKRKADANGTGPNGTGSNKTQISPALSQLASAGRRRALSSQQAGDQISRGAATGNGPTTASTESAAAARDASTSSTNSSRPRQHSMSEGDSSSARHAPSPAIGTDGAARHPTPPPENVDRRGRASPPRHHREQAQT